MDYQGMHSTIQGAVRRGTYGIEYIAQAGIVVARILRDDCRYAPRECGLVILHADGAVTRHAVTRDGGVATRQIMGHDWHGLGYVPARAFALAIQDACGEEDV